MWAKVAVVLFAASLKADETIDAVKPIKGQHGECLTKQCRFFHMHNYRHIPLTQGCTTSVDDHGEEMNIIVECSQANGTIQSASRLWQDFAELAEYRYLVARKISMYHIHVSTDPEVLLGILSEVEVLNLLTVVNTSLQMLPRSAFEQNQHIGEMKMSYNEIEILETGIFQNMRKLQTLDFSHNKITTIEGEVFTRLPHLENVNLSHNKITLLRNGTFTALEFLKNVDISKNNLEILEVCAFFKLLNLEVLDLSDNKLTTLRNGVFDNLPSLNSVKLSRNEIKHIEPYVFYGDALGPIRTVNLRWNKLTSIDPWPLTLKRDFLVDLDNNDIRETTNHINWFYTCQMDPLHGIVQMSYNNISHILPLLQGWGFNNSQDAELRIICMFRDDALRIDIRRNPFNCDCIDFPVYRYFRKTKISVIIDQMICEKPAELYGQKMITVPMHKFQCLHTERCPAGCKCVEAPNDKPFFIQCPGAEMSKLPESLPPLMRHYYLYDLELQDNNIHEVNDRDYFIYTVRLDLSNNRINRIDDEAVEGLKHIPVIHLNHNNLTTLPSSVQNLTDVESVLEEITFHGNNWNCDCEHVWLKHWMLTLKSKIQNPEGILCHSPPGVQGRHLLSLPDEEFICGEPIDWIFTLMLCTTILLASVTVIIYYGWHKRMLLPIKVWFFIKYGIHPFDKDNRGSESMWCDAYICFVSHDEDTATEIKMYLESHNFVVIMQPQTFHAGENICNKAASLTSKSRRVVFIISPHFFESYINVWLLEHIYSELDYRDHLNILKTGDLESTDAPRYVPGPLQIFLKKYEVVQDIERYKKYLLYNMPTNPLRQDHLSLAVAATGEVDNVIAAGPLMNITSPISLLQQDLHPEFDHDEERIFDVFMSYAEEQKEWVRGVVTDLEQRGYSICVHHRDFHYGTEIFENIGIALDRSKRMLCIISQDFINSYICMWEFQAALVLQLEKKQRIIAVLYDKREEMVLNTTLESYLARYTYLEHSEKLVDKLIKDLPQLQS